MSNDKNKNNKKNALVTGAAKRVGRALALALAADGWNVALHHNGSDVADVEAECQKLGAKTCVIRADLADFSALQKVVPAANAALGEISLLINNASVFEKCSFADTDESLFERQININFKAPFFLSQAFAAQTKNADFRGHIINIADTNIARNNTTYFAYLLSKKALVNLADMLALSLAPQIRVNSILPATIAEFSDNVDLEYTKKRTQELPMQAMTTISEVIESLRFLINSNLTGQKIFADGGEQLL